MSTNTLLKEIIGTLRNLQTDMTGKQWETCGHAIDSLCETVFWTPPEPLPEPSNIEGDPSAVWLIEGQYEVNTDANLCLETPEEAMKPNPPIEDLLEEIDRTYDAICYVVNDYSGPQEEVIKRLQKALKHLDKALIILEGDED